MSARFILRCDDVAQKPEPQSERDVGLEYFREWLTAWGPCDEPIYLGVVPAAVGPEERAWLLELERTTKAEIALHGWDHYHHVLQPDDVRRGHEVFPLARHHIPPFNEYDVETIRAIAKLGRGQVIFGGFNGERKTHTYGEAPCMVEGVLHLSADPRLYAHCYRLIDVVQEVEDPGYPLVVTLHHRWDFGRLPSVTALREALRGRIVSTAEATA